MPDGPTLFDFVNPLELRVEKTAADIKSEHQAATQEADTSEQRDIQHSVDDITTELVRLLERPAEVQPIEGAGEDRRNRSTQDRE
jgi:hypothetical protein